RLLCRTQEVQPSAQRALQQLLDRQLPVDLVGPLEDAVDAAVAVGGLDRVVGREAVTAVHLQRLVYDRVKYLGAEDLDEAELDRVVRQRLHLRAGRLFGAQAPGVRPCLSDSRIDLARQPVHGALQRVAVRRHAAYLLLDETEVRDGRAELPAFARVGLCQADQPLHAADRTDGQLEPADVEDAERYVVTFTHPAKEVPLRHLGVLEDHHPRGGPLYAHL